MLINNTVIEEPTIITLIQNIKKKKELSNVSNDFVRKAVQEYLKKNPKKITHLKNQKSKNYKEIIKQVRANLRKVYGLFRLQEQSTLRHELINKLTASNIKQLTPEILATHASTKERLPIYTSLYKKIFAITGKPKNIIDIGCGINPFSIPYMNLKTLTYHAYDISDDEVDHLTTFFTKLQKANSSFNGYADILDILQFQYLTNLENADITFLFKMTAVLDRGKGHKITELVLDALPSKYIVVSFATKTMSGKKMTAPKRKWMEWLCKRKNYKYKTITFANELFYVIKK